MDENQMDERYTHLVASDSEVLKDNKQLYSVVRTFVCKAGKTRRRRKIPDVYGKYYKN